MKVRCLLVISLLLLQACAENPGSSVASMAATTVMQPDSCRDTVAPNRDCSKTVTATFSRQGRLWLAWVQNEHVYVQSSDDKGRTYSAPVMVNSIAEPIIAHDEYRPKIQLDNRNNIYLTWTRSLEKRHTGHIRFSRSTDGGKNFSEPVTLNDNLAVISHRFDSLAIGENGEVFVAWLDARDKVKAKQAGEDYLGTSLYYAWSDDNGASFKHNRLAAAHTCECCRLGTAIDNDNLPLVIWRHVYPGQIRDHALLKFADWNTPGELKRLSREDWKIDACPHHGPALAVADDGSYHATWFSGAESRPGLFYAHSEDQGHSFSPAMQFGGNGAKHPHVAVAGQQVAITWLEFDGSNTVVKLLQSFDGGKQWSEPKQIGQTGESADYAFLVADNETLYLSWQTRQGYRINALSDS
ncbi:sialidase family protein [Methylomonas methanica]|uniref:BNR/Asp-box repeat-containing protein n=1 Tax=Methylomonas methanica (strain DSM 25384 / MC09) TaxID=857087 RepID=F9ZXG8_METMM|nr:sialidase family protein [Methylomonas methanica]AEG00956.1 BNR/Asp-box repeat-containing protein [Methylomonas methanica MC09]